MNCNESKIVLRAEFPQLKGKSLEEVYPFYLEILGKPDEKEDYNGKIEYFSYEGKFQPCRNYNTGQWGIDWVLHHESDYKTYIEMKGNSMSLDEFEKMENTMAQLFGVDKSKIRLISYTWYNGGDEPCKFE